LKAVAVLGVSGSVAQALLRVLEEDSTIARIVGIDLHPPRFHPAKLEFHPADLRQAPLTTLLRGIDGLVHLATSGLLEPGFSGHVRRVVAVAREVGARRMVMITSIAAYGAHANNPVPIQEWHPLRPNPDVPVACAWAEVEQALEQLEAESGSPGLVRLRTAMVVGPSLEGERARLITLPRVVLAGALNPKIQLTHEEDLARACHLALRADVRGAFHVAGLEPMTLSALYEAGGAQVHYLPAGVLRAMSRVAARLRSTLVPPEMLELAAHPILVSTVRTRQELGWEPRFTTLEAFLDARMQVRGT
jgi:UDP-glucose 4-epimerase